MVKLIFVCGQISCVPATAFGRSMVHSSDARVTRVNETVSSLVHHYSVVNLLPGICYLCSLRASTRRGFGPPSTRLVWTQPDSMLFHFVKYVVCSKCFVVNYSL